MQVNGETKLGEGYNIASKEMCNQFCSLTTGCQYWTWYSRVLEEDVMKDDVCYALSRCDLVTQKCEACISGKKVSGTMFTWPWLANAQLFYMWAKPWGQSVSLNKVYTRPTHPNTNFQGT